jgi:hypothetical protein
LGTLEPAVTPIRKSLTALNRGDHHRVCAVATPTTADARWRGWWGPARAKLSLSTFVDLCARNVPEVHMSTQSEAKKAKLEKPANYYKSPDDITKDADLSPDEKRQALNTWEQDARQMLTASNEGMEGDEEGLDQGDTHRLGEVERAKAKIGAKPKHKPSH